MLLRSACEPLFKDRGRPQTTYRTHERWVELHEQRLGQFRIVFGDERGTIDETTFFDEDGAMQQFERIKRNYEMDEDAPKRINQLIKEKVVFT